MNIFVKNHIDVQGNIIQTKRIIHTHNLLAAADLLYFCKKPDTGTIFYPRPFPVYLPDCICGDFLFPLFCSNETGF